MAARLTGVIAAAVVLTAASAPHMASRAARADEPGSGRVSPACSRASFDALCARTIELPRWTLASLASAAPTLDYDFFKGRVEAVFLQKRDGLTRCYVCHAESNNAFRLERMSPGANAWSEEQSRKNFEMASKLVNPGDPDTSRLLQQPLALEAGGNIYHSGGRQFASKDDPGWKTLADWINGKKL